MNVPSEMLVPILTLVITQLVVPFYLFYAQWRGKDDSKLAWLVKVLYTGVYLLYIFLAGRWDWLSYYLRFLLPILFVVATVVSFRRVRKLPMYVRGGRWRWVNIGASVLVLLVFLGFLGFTVRGFFYSDEPARLAFPLRDGRYYVGQGGNSTLLNYHNPNRAQQYALDVAALNTIGTRANGLYPTALDEYAVFGATIHSPCDGTVTEAVDGFPDLIPPAADRDNLEGNHVVIDCPDQDVKVLLAHMQNDSLMVQTGEAVTTGQPVGRVGNTGNTSEPHLHIHAVRSEAEDVLKGEGVPMLFDGTFAVRNTIVGL